MRPCKEFTVPLYIFQNFRRIPYGSKAACQHAPVLQDVFFCLDFDVFASSEAGRLAVLQSVPPRVCQPCLQSCISFPARPLSPLIGAPFLFSRWDLGKTYNIVLGSGQVVLGMDMGLREMCVGEKRTVIIPPHLGYGEAGVGE